MNITNNNIKIINSITGQEKKKNQGAASKNLKLEHN